MIPRAGEVRGVLVGRNGRLYLGSQDAFDVHDFVSDTGFNPTLIQRWRRTLRRRAREMKRRGIPYAVWFVPDAHSVYPEDLPAGIDPHFTPPSRRFLDAVRDIEDVIFIDPLDALRSAKGGLDLYKKTESHWTEYGSYIGYQQFCRAVSPFVDITQIPARDVVFKFKRLFGDLGVQMEPEQSEMVPTAILSGHEGAVEASNDGVGRVGLLYSYSSTAVKSKAMFYRDSFMSDLFPYITRSFSETMMAGSTSRVFLDFVDSWKPNIVTNEIGERRLHVWESDHGPECFEDIYRNDFTGPSGKAALRAMLHLQRGNDSEAAIHTREFADHNDLDPGLAYIAARVAFSQRAFADAERLINMALAGWPERPSYLCLASQAAFGLGDNKRAISLARRSIEQMPYNGYFHELLLYELITDGQHEAAYAHVQSVLADFDDNQILHFWAAALREYKGEMESACEAIAEALILYPEDPSALEIAKRLGCAPAEGFSPHHSAPLN